MTAAPALFELQCQFLAALYDEDTSSVDFLVGNGLEPAARQRIYRNSAAEIHTQALRTAYPAVLALVGEGFFERATTAYRRLRPSRTGNLQVFGAGFGDFLDAMPETRELPYLGDVARLEWQRQQAALAPDAEPLTWADFARTVSETNAPLKIALHPSLRRFVCRHRVLSIWHYALHPESERLELAPGGERVLLWRSDDQIAMAATDAATFTCVGALAEGVVLDTAHAAALKHNPQFDLAGCITTLAGQGLIVGLTTAASRENQA